MVKETLTVCPYCGAGCLMVLTVKDNRIIKVSLFMGGDRFLCPKALKIIDFVHNPVRLTKARHVPYLKQRTDRAYLQINPEDAARCGLSEGDDAEVSSRRGKVMLATNITTDVPHGIVFAPFHFCESPINLLTNNALDPESKTPGYKVSAVRIKKSDAGETLKDKAKECGYK